MLIFDKPETAPYMGMVLAIVCFVIQLVFCFKTKKQIIKHIPVYLIIMAWVFIFFICTGIFGKDGGFIGNVHLIVAAILSIVLGVASVGIVAAWVVYKIYVKKKK